tara:strand:+ start:306 stop:503 length:198 start_codon:yes stop_codon:yes gene_type:complete
MSDEMVQFLVIVFVLNTILFVKVWGMTSNLKRFMIFYMHENGISYEVSIMKGERYIDKDGKKIKM